MKISFFNRKNAALMDHVLEVRKYDKQLTKNWKVLKSTASEAEFSESLRIVEDCIENLKRISQLVDPYVDLSGIYDYEKELEENRDSWYEAVKERAK